MKQMNVIEKMKFVVDTKKTGINARMFITREDGITIYDTVQDKTTSSVSALVSGVWQASEALMGMVHPEQNVFEFRFAFDTSSRGVFLFPITVQGKKYFLGTIYNNYVNPGQLKHQVSLIKEELERLLPEAAPVKAVSATRTGYLFQDISDEEMDRLFSPGGI